MLTYICSLAPIFITISVLGINPGGRLQDGWQAGGAEYPGNMQWQTTAETKAKDRWNEAGQALTFGGDRANMLRRLFLRPSRSWSRLGVFLCRIECALSDPSLDWTGIPIFQTL